jgi:co-chaperonin GroES (HSP10)
MTKKVFKPMGARLLVQEIITTLSLEERGKRAGLTVIVESDNRPPASTGTVVALGSDPIFEGNVKEGDVVHFHPRAGYEQHLEGKQYRMLEWQEITAVEQLVEELPDPPASAPLDPPADPLTQPGPTHQSDPTTQGVSSAPPSKPESHRRVLAKP